MIKAYVEKQRKLQKNPTLYASADDTMPKRKDEPVEMSGVWHEPDGSSDGGDGLQGGRFKIPMDSRKKPVKPAPAMVEPKVAEVKR